MSNKGGRVSPDYLADIAPEYAVTRLQIWLLNENRVKLERVYYPIIAYRNFVELVVSNYYELG